MLASCALGVNIDHVATLRQARKTNYPDPILAASAAERGGADGITLHLREDRRHIQYEDVLALKGRLQTKMNLEMAMTAPMIAIAQELRPEACCIVPERREELTTEGGLDVVRERSRVKDVCSALHTMGIEVSLFIDPDFAQIDAAYESSAKVIEIHTGHYAGVEDTQERHRALSIIQRSAAHAKRLGLKVNAGHGLHYTNVQSIAMIPEITELNIGHSIISRALFCGLETAVREMKHLIATARL